MPSKSKKKSQGPTLYTKFINAYMKARPNENRADKYNGAKLEWKEIKWNEEYVKEKLEQYLEKYNEFATSSKEDIERPLSPSFSTQSKINYYQPKKKSKIDQSNDNNENITDDKQSQNFEDINKDIFEDDDNDEEKKKKKAYCIKKRKTIEEELLYEYPKELPGATGGPFQALVKQKKTPAQERLFQALSSINDRIAALVQVRQMGLSTSENRKQLKQLIKDRNKKFYELKYLQSKQISSTVHQVKKKQIVQHLFETKPELHPQLKKLYRRSAGRPRVEEECPDLLQIIEEIVKVGGATDDRRSSEIIRPCLTLDDLREKIKQRGYDIKRTTLYYR
ncbi:unnamed protein product, partial [Rotaria sp. Silwood2]